MRSIIQKVKHSSVEVNGKINGRIEKGLTVLLGITHEDTEKEADILYEKIVNLRIFEDENGKMNLSLKDVGGSLLIISQFTLYADCKKGRRPSFTKAARPEKAIPLYEYFIEKAKADNINTQTGVFGEFMEVIILNDGPVTIFLDTNEL